MQRLDDERLSWVFKTAQKYREDLADTEAEAYLMSRGLTRETIRSHGLGLVTEPSTEHEMFDGYLSIPYLRKTPRDQWICPSIRFRCIEDHEHVGHGKYMTMAGDRPRLYNTLALTTSDDVVAICEGELDTVAASQAGIPAIGLPGAESWQDSWVMALEGFSRVILLPDGDPAGERWARKLAKILPGSRMVQSPEGKDVNDLLLELGEEGLYERVME